MSGFRVRPVTPPLWAIGADYFSPKLQYFARQIPGLRWMGAHRAYVGYLDAVEAVAGTLRAAGFNVDDATIPPVDTGYVHNIPVSYTRSRDYQKTGIDFLIAAGPGGALLADDLSLGKGHQSLRAARAFKHRTLVVCPSHVRGVWERAPSEGDEAGGEIHKWWPVAAKAGIERPYGLTPRPLSPAALITVIHYDVIHAWVDAIKEWAPGTFIGDELHVCQGASSRRSKAIAEITATCAVRIALTGTPPTDYPRDFHNLLNILSPDRFGNFFDYGRRYCNGRKVEIKIAGGVTKTVWNFDGRSNEDELRQRVGRMMLRRLKGDVAKEMPAKIRQVIDVQVPARSRVIPHFEQIKKSAAMRRSLDFAADAKLPHAIALVRSHLREGKKVVVFTWRKAVAESVAGECANDGLTSFIHSGVSQAQRSSRISKAKTNEGGSLLACTIDSISTGVDLSFASVAVFVELSWKPRELLQAEGRLHRIGILDPTLVQYVIARGTADELILAGVVRKLDTRDALLGKGDDRLREELAPEESQEDALARLADAIRGMKPV